MTFLKDDFAPWNFDKFTFHFIQEEVPPVSFVHYSSLDGPLDIVKKTNLTLLHSVPLTIDEIMVDNRGVSMSIRYNDIIIERATLSSCGGFYSGTIFGEEHLGEKLCAYISFGCKVSATNGTLTVSFSHNNSWSIVSPLTMKQMEWLKCISWIPSDKEIAKHVSDLRNLHNLLVQ